MINHQKLLFSKLKSIWEEAVKLVDILNCKCKISLCSELGCSKEVEDRCKKNSLPDCYCERQFKIPQLELAFVKAQRQKAGVDIPESSRLTEAIGNKNDKMEAEEKVAMKRRRAAQKTAEGQQTAREFMNEGSEECSGGVRDDEFNIVPPPEAQPALVKKKYNTMEIPTLALASMRHHTGMRETAEIATATLIDAGVITESDTSLVIDHNKVRRAQEKLSKELQDKFDKKIQESGVSCLLFDG